MTLDTDRVLDEDLAGAGAEGEGPSLRDELAAALAACDPLRKFDAAACGRGPRC